MDTQNKIVDKLSKEFTPSKIEVVDESYKHVGHEGAKGGGGHFLLTIVSKAFEQKGKVERHRMIYGILADEMQAEIHALGIKAFTPEEWQDA